MCYTNNKGTNMFVSPYENREKYLKALDLLFQKAQCIVNL